MSNISLKSTIIDNIETEPKAVRLKRSANALKLVPRIHIEALISSLLMGFFARAKERTRRIKRRAMDGRLSKGAIAGEREKKREREEE